nr:unnamed protein product [Digitaria exilis]
MRSSWFHKLRRKRRGGDPDDDKPVAPAPSPCSPSPNRASYYVPTKDRAPFPVPAGEDNPKLRDTHFPRSPQPNDIVFDVVVTRRRDDRFNAMPDLKLRPIVTRPPKPNAAAASPDTTTNTAACRMRRPRFPPPPPSRRRKAAEEDEACGRRRRRQSGSCKVRSWMYESRVVVKDSADPEEDFLESMAEMIAANGVTSPRGLEDLLACYLALNAPDHYHAIVAAFRRAWVHLHSPPAKGRPRCFHESRFT